MENRMLSYHGENRGPNFQWLSPNQIFEKALAENRVSGTIYRNLKAKRGTANTAAARGNSAAALIAEEDALFKKIMNIGGTK